MHGGYRRACWGSTGARWRSGRRLAPANRRDAGQEKQRTQRRMGQARWFRRQPQLEFVIGVLPALRLALLGLSLLDKMAKTAGMFAVESHGDCLHEGGGSRIISDHFGPGERLEHRPGYSQGQHERGRQRPPLCKSDHKARLSIAADLARSIGVRRILASGKVVKGGPYPHGTMDQTSTLSVGRGRHPGGYRSGHVTIADGDAGNRFEQFVRCACHGRLVLSPGTREPVGVHEAGIRISRATMASAQTGDYRGFFEFHPETERLLASERVADGCWRRGPVRFLGPNCARN